MTTMTQIRSEDHEKLEALPHGITVTIPGNSEHLVMNREDGPSPIFDSFNGETYTGYLRPSNVFSFYRVDTVTVSD